MARRRRRQQQDDYGCAVLLLGAIVVGGLFSDIRIGLLVLLLVLLGGVAIWLIEKLVMGSTFADGWQRTAAQQRSPRCVYMLRAGPYYKLGKTTNFARRHKEIALQLPFEAHVVHTIATDDETALEAYWHRRFSTRRRNGEWFELTEADVAEFTRQTAMSRQ